MQKKYNCGSSPIKSYACNSNILQPVIETNTKNIDLYLKTLCETKDKLKEEVSSVVDGLTNIQDEFNSLVNENEEKYQHMKKKFELFLKMIKSHPISGEKNLNKNEIVEEQDFFDLISESSNCKQFFTLCTTLQDRIQSLQFLKEDIHLKDFLIKSHEYINQHADEETFLRKKTIRPSTFVKEEKEAMIMDIQNNKKEKSKESTSHENAANSEEKIRKILDDIKRTSSPIEDEHEETEMNNAEEAIIKPVDISSDGQSRKKCILGKNEKLKKRKPITYCNYILIMKKYSHLSSESSPKVELSEESSDFALSSVKLEAYDKISDLKSIRASTYPSILEALKKESDQISLYVSQNFDKCLQIRTLYYSEFDMTCKPVAFNYEYLCRDTNLIEGATHFQNVKLVLVRKGANPIYTAIKYCAGFFMSYIKRKDCDGNTMIKGILNSTFDKFQNYFTGKIKGFENLEAVQIEVYLYKWDLFFDYDSKVDKTNMSNEDMLKMISLAEKMNRLRIAERKMKMIEESEKKTSSSGEEMRSCV